MADNETNDLYHGWREIDQGQSAKANGYRSQAFFEREQSAVMRFLSAQDPILDIACGSGLMLAPLVTPEGGENRTIIGLEYNAAATQATQINGLTVIRGDAFQLPLSDNSVAQIINCQFLNQQTPQNAKQFMKEAVRVLQPGGQMILLWRHGRSALHTMAHFVLTQIDRLTGEPVFPQYIHHLEDIKRYARQAGLSVHREAVTTAAWLPRLIDPASWLAACFGASYLLVLTKPESVATPGSKQTR